jgi:DNA mismatch endonuclease (patch repair protein)
MTHATRMFIMMNYVKETGSRDLPLDQGLASGIRFSSMATTPAIRRVMQGNRSRDTKPEIAVRSAVHALGMRYRVSARPLRALRRTADLVFWDANVAVFVDGCFWHGCPEHHAPPKTNASYWATTIRGNKSRDEDTTERLRGEGWAVLRFWSHEEPLSVATQIAKA